MGYGAQHAGVGAGTLEPRQEADAISSFHLARVGEGVVNVRLDAAPSERRNHAGHLRVANIRHVLLERNSKHEDRPVRGFQAAGDLFDDEGPHRVVGAAPREDDLGVVPISTARWAR